MLSFEQVMQNGGYNKGLKYEPPKYACSASVMNKPIAQQLQQQQQPQQQQYQQAVLPQRAAPPVPANRPYMKPLPKLPPNIGNVLVVYQDILFNSRKIKLFITDEGPERSSTEDISSRPNSPSLSSSNEDILKPTATICDRGDLPSTVDKHLLSRHADIEWMIRGGYPQYGGVDDTSKLNSIDLAYLKDLDISSTTESQAPSTLPPNNKEVESCTSFEYHKNGIINSPFQREIQRLLDSSSSKIPVPVGRANGPGINSNNYFSQKPQTNNIGNYSNYRSGSIGSTSNTRNNINMTKYEFESVDKPNNYMQGMISGGSGGGAAGSKHPVGLEAIKEIAKNTTAPDTNHM